ncbi:MAG: hypothetical protein DMG27_02070 [Acidobacteria bacterium]|nr:MAG: hypothetical protein DMG27_02070 [Acidobacteriota bacterium]
MPSGQAPANWVGKSVAWVIDGSIEAELILYESTFLASAGDADRSRARHLRQLAACCSEIACRNL